MVKGKGARDKGSRAERKWRDELRRIYPTELRKNVQRIPMSGAGYIKGDVADQNDPDSCYEVKNQERLNIPEWWRQAVSQAGSTRTPILVFTQNHAPFYVVFRLKDWEALRENCFRGFMYNKLNEVNTGSKIFRDMAELEEFAVGQIEIDGSTLVVVPSELYIDIKRQVYENSLT